MLCCCRALSVTFIMLWLTLLAVWWSASGGGGAGAVPATDKPFYPEAAHAQHFAAFKVTYNKQYATLEEEQRRFNAFKKNLATINELNANDEYAVYDINEEADLTEDEIEAKYRDSAVGGANYVGGFKVLLPEDMPEGNRPPPESFDWRDKGVVSKPRDQKNCNASYVFSMVGGIESQYFMTTRKHTTFSVQQAIDCDKRNKGCNGGDFLTTCIYYEANGIMTEDDYKYVGSSVKCAYDAKKAIGQKGSGTICVFFLVPERSLTNFVAAHGPISTVIDGRQFQWYRSGIITECAFKGYNYVTLLTGYGHDKNGVKYWSLQNSKGENWGEKGYARIKRGIECLGIAKENFTVGGSIWKHKKKYFENVLNKC